ncbi:MAG: peptide chain release factor N(5)-glutamine methyltransferase [Candidatus Buchananbacteria bacterium]
MTIKDALNVGWKKLKQSKIINPELDSEILLSHTLNKSKEYLFVNYDKKITDKKFNNFWNLIKKRSKHEPVAYLTGHKEFFGQEFKVNKDVLIPRWETEQLLEEIKEYVHNINSDSSNLTLADIGTGSGIIAISLSKMLPKAKILAVDISPKALKIARINSKNHKAKIDYFKGNLLSPIKNQQIDIIVANLPYIDIKEKQFNKKSQQELYKKTLTFEPSIALYGGKLGLEIYNKFFGQILNLKHKPQAIFCEIGHPHISDTKKIVKRFFPKANFEIKKDLSGYNRILIIELTKT